MSQFQRFFFLMLELFWWSDIFSLYLIPKYCSYSLLVRRIARMLLLIEIQCWIVRVRNNQLYVINMLFYMGIIFVALFLCVRYISIIEHISFGCSHTSFRWGISYLRIKVLDMILYILRNLNNYVRRRIYVKYGNGDVSES